MRTALNKFGLNNANPVTTPLDPNVNLDDNETEDYSQDEKISQSYATLIGSLMYLALGTRPVVMCRLRLGLKAPALAWLCWARAL